MVLDTDARAAEASAQPGKRRAVVRTAGNQGQAGNEPAAVPTADAAKVETSARLGKELALVKHYALLGIVNVILEHDIRVAGTAPTKLPRLYESMMRGLQDRVLLELAGLRMQFKASGIGAFEERRTKESLAASYRCMGCERSFSMPWAFVKAEAERLLKGYFEIKRH
ncbi:hypothetical protein GXP70_20535 [Paenibacillus lycopersici]|uniref:Uncharacterized protein n=1 Tax=Paenibacillus lycopersici TaxID=2704462 RepID=A0A6C0G450_9BACL|nr:hypothetical protein [Paenibacillus lycopersici]QHT62129.1 hypothetical protein GXP70_20535 [Paenibacillus lycopersici]